MAHAQLARLEAEGKLDERLRYEILNGQLVIRGFPLIAHEHAINTLMGHLLEWVRLRDKRDIHEALGVGEYWVVDLPAGRVVVHRRDAAGRYQTDETVTGTVTTPAAPGLAVPVNELLPGG